jgi:hypothetical protein
VLLKPHPAAVFLDDALASAQARHAFICMAKPAAAGSLGRDLENRNVVVMRGANGQSRPAVFPERVQRVPKDLRTDLKQLVGVSEYPGQLIIEFHQHLEVQRLPL